VKGRREEGGEGERIDEGERREGMDDGKAAREESAGQKRGRHPPIQKAELWEGQKSTSASSSSSPWSQPTRAGARRILTRRPRRLRPKNGLRKLT
jgi:hypothetical protein